MRILHTTSLIFFLLLLSSCNSADVMGQPWNESGQCWETRQEAGSSSDGPGGEDAITFAQSPSGRYWQFSQTTIPDDFELVEDTELKDLFYQNLDKNCP